MKIKKFFEFKENIDFYIFDFDDTLVETPDFEKIALPYLKENLNIEDLINKCKNEIDFNRNEIKFLDGRIYIDDPNHLIKIPNNSKYWIRKGLRVYLLQPNEFSLLDESIPKKTKELKDLYNSVENKCIVTARPEIIREKIIKSLKELGFEYPKFGLHMYPYLNHRNAGEWKGKKIVELVKETGFKSAIFYDDNSKYIKKAKKVIDNELPGFNIKYVKV
jgi:hypothetical protein